VATEKIVGQGTDKNAAVKPIEVDRRGKRKKEPIGSAVNLSLAKLHSL